MTSEAHAQSSNLWNGGWYRFAHPIRSPNFNQRPASAAVDLIVIHSISLPPGQYGGDEVQRLFTNTLDWSAHPYFKTIENTQVSSHFYIRRNGELFQFVSCDDRAWHAGASSYRDRGNCNDDSIGIELEGLEGGPFEAAQYETLASLCSAIAQRHAIRHIAGHEHIAPGRKTTPARGLTGCISRKIWAGRLSVFPRAPAPFRVKNPPHSGFR